MHTARRTNHFTLFCKRNSSEIRKLQALMTVTVRLVPESEKQLAMARSCCIPDLLCAQRVKNPPESSNTEWKQKELDLYAGI